MRWSIEKPASQLAGGRRCRRGGLLRAGCNHIRAKDCDVVHLASKVAVPQLLRPVGKGGEVGGVCRPHARKLGERGGGRRSALAALLQAGRYGDMRAPRRFEQAECLAGKRWLGA